MTENPKFEVPCTWFNIRRASRAITQHFDHELHETGLRITQLSILYMLEHSGPSKLTDIAERLVIDRTTLTRNLKPLIKLGLIRSSNGKDKRTRILGLSKSGTSKLHEALPIWKKANEHFIKGLGFPCWNKLMEELSDAVNLTKPECS